MKSHKDYLRWKKENVSLRGIENFNNRYDTNGNGNIGRFGEGLYTAFLSNKKMAKEYGKVYFVVNGKPKKPLKTNNPSSLENYIYEIARDQGYKSPIDAYKNGVKGAHDLLINAGYDGIQITGREYANFTPENVLYFENERLLENYFYNFV